MSVIINELEVIISPPEKAAEGKTEPATSPPASQIAPQDIRNILRYLTQRAQRIHAH
jgi:hypothetical protein